MSDKEMFQALHPDPNKQGARVTKATFDIYRQALLKLIPADEAGVELQSLFEDVVPLVPPEIAETTSPGWWTMTVKLDLEARGVIERVPGPGRQRVRRK